MISVSPGTPLVSVCVPTYNGAEFMQICIDSLLDQHLRDLEVVVSDDGSRDDTLEIVRRRGDPRVRILPTTTRAGMAGNWNRSLAGARGKYVALVAQDDFVAPQWGERLVELLESHPEADLAFSRRDFGISDEHTRQVVGDFFEHKYPTMMQPFYARIGTVIPPEVMIDAAMQHGFTLNLIGEPSFTMVRRDHPATREGYHLGMRQMLDWEFAIRFFADKPILHCAESLGTYRIHAAGASVDHAAQSRQYQEYKHLLDSVLSRLHSRLTAAQTCTLTDRRAEIDHMLHLLKHVGNLESSLAHARQNASDLEQELARRRAPLGKRALSRLKRLLRG